MAMQATYKFYLHAASKCSIANSHCPEVHKVPSLPTTNNNKQQLLLPVLYLRMDHTWKKNHEVSRLLKYLHLQSLATGRYSCRLFRRLICYLFSFCKNLAWLCKQWILSRQRNHYCSSCTHCAGRSLDSACLSSLHWIMCCWLHQILSWHQSA